MRLALLALASCAAVSDGLLPDVGRRWDCNLVEHRGSMSSTEPLTLCLADRSDVLVVMQAWKVECMGRAGVTWCDGDCDPQNHLCFQTR